MGVTATCIGIGVGAALIGGASGAGTYYYMEQRNKRKELLALQRYKEQLADNDLYNRRIRSVYNRY